MGSAFTMLALTRPLAPLPSSLTSCRRRRQRAASCKAATLLGRWWQMPRAPCPWTSSSSSCSWRSTSNSSCCSCSATRSCWRSTACRARRPPAHTLSPWQASTSRHPPHPRWQSCLQDWAAAHAGHGGGARPWQTPARRGRQGAAGRRGRRPSASGGAWAVWRGVAGGTKQAVCLQARAGEG